MRTYYVLVGLPGSGKTTWSQKFIEKTYSSVSVSSDDIREFLYGSRSVQGNIWGIFKEVLKTRITERWEHIILDATSAKKRDRKNLIGMIRVFETSDEFKIVCVHFNVPYEICVERNEKRPHPVPMEAMRRFRDALRSNPPSASEEDFDELWEER